MERGFLSGTMVPRDEEAPGLNEACYSLAVNVALNNER